MYKGGAQPLAIGPAEQKHFQESYNDALRVLTDRIFIAEEVKTDKLYDLWTSAMTELQKTNDVSTLSDRFEEIKNRIVKAATK
jgi:hypothetical protein